MFEKFPNLFKFPKSFTQFWKSPIYRHLRGIACGAHNWTRTSDFYLVEVTLYQLSYASEGGILPKKT